MRTTRVMFLALAVAAVCVIAGSLASAQGETGGAPAGDGQALLPPVTDEAVPGSATVEDTSARDPRGGPPWRVRLHRTEQGRTCFTAGRVVGGRFGEVDRRGGFTEAPLDGAAVCQEPTPPVDFSVLTGSSGPDAGDDITVVTGVVADDVRRVEVQLGGDSSSAVPSQHGAFVAAFGQAVDQNSLPLVEATFTDGTKQTFTIDQ